MDLALDVVIDERLAPLAHRRKIAATPPQRERRAEALDDRQAERGTVSLRCNSFAVASRYAESAPARAAGAAFWHNEGYRDLDRKLLHP